jgi:pyruvyltransferase
MIETPSFGGSLLPAIPSVSAFWWRVQNWTNWGDLLTPLLLRRFADVETQWASPDEADVVCVGSILGNLIKPSYTGVILGSGKMFEDGEVPSKATILALRGPLTALGVAGDFVLGDPGLIADELVTVDKKTHELGIVPHWSDKTLGSDKRFTQYDHIVIDPHADPIEVIRQIGSCKKIVASSLHALIVADAFWIPRRFEATAHWAREGGLFKVRDHNAAVGLTRPELEIGHVQRPDWHRVSDLKNGLYDAFEEFGAMIRARS